MWTLQITEPFSTKTDAKEALDAATEHPGFLGGTYGEYPGSDGYYVQVFFSADKPSPDILEFSMDSLPDGAKHVFIPPVLQRWYGFKEPQPAKLPLVDTARGGL